MVSMVMPETGLLAVVAMALAATEVKKNAKTSVSTRPRTSDGPGGLQRPKKMADDERAGHDAEQDGEIGMSRSVRSGAAPPRRGGRRAARCRTSRQRCAAI